MIDSDSMADFDQRLEKGFKLAGTPGFAGRLKPGSSPMYWLLPAGSQELVHDYRN